MATISVAVIENMSEELDYVEVGAATLLLAHLSGGKSVSVSAAHKVVGSSRKEWAEISDRVLSFFDVSDAGEISHTETKRTPETAPRVSEEQKVEVAETPKAKSPLPPAGRALQLPFEFKASSFRAPPARPKTTTSATTGSVKKTTIEIIVSRLKEEGKTHNQAQAIAVKLFKDHPDEEVISAVHTAQRNEPVDLVSYLYGVLKKKKAGGFSNLTSPAPRKPRPVASPEELGISAGRAAQVRKKNSNLKLSLED